MQGRCVLVGVLARRRLRVSWTGLTPTCWASLLTKETRQFNMLDFSCGAERPFIQTALHPVCLLTHTRVASKPSGELHRLFFFLVRFVCLFRVTNFFLISF